MEDANALPDMPEPGAGGRGQLLESVASTLWSLTFLAYSSSGVLSEFGRGAAARWTLALVAAPPFFASLHPLLQRDARAARAAAAYAAYVAAPPLAAAAAAPAGDRLLADAAAFAALWLPLELRLLPRIGPTRRVAIWPALTAALAAVNTFVVLRPFDTGRGVGYSFKLPPADVALALLAGAGAAAAALPLAAAVGYGHLRPPRGLQLKPQLAIFMGVYFVALGEEILFRGIAQNILERALAPDAVLPVVVAAAMTGVAQLKSKAQGFAQPNWRAAIPAAVSALVQGLVWRWTGKVTASAITHACVGYALRTCLRKHAL